MNWLDEVLDKDSKLFHAGEISFHSARETDSGGRTVVFKLILTTAQQRMANPFSVATRRRGKKAGSRFRMSISPVNHPAPEEPWNDEVMLLAWADSPAGSTVTFLLPDCGQLSHPFMHSSKADHWMAAFVELSDDEKPVDQKLAKAAEDTPKQHTPQKLSNQAALLIKSPQFRVWLNVSSAAEADARLKERCHIQSKAELDTDREAAYKFKSLRAEFNSR